MAKRANEFRVRPVRRKQPDVQAIAKALIELAIEETKRDQEGEDTFGEERSA